MMPLVESAIPVRFMAGAIDSKRDAFLVMFRLVIGNTMATGRRLKDIAKDLGVTKCKLAHWISGVVGDNEVEAMSRKCFCFAHGIGLDLVAVEVQHLRRSQ